jgi:putative endonuclease
MQSRDGTTVFVEVRRRSSRSHGGAAASVVGVKQRRIIFAARHYLLRLRTQPPCRFDVVLVEPEGLQWLQAAFDAS